MKTIYLIRHAKSSWANHQLSDKERPLNQRGISDTQKIGKKLNELGFHPDKIISSSSVRTTETIKLLCQHIPYSFQDVAFTSTLYHPTNKDFISVIENVDDATNSIALVSHNYGISEFADYLTQDFVSAMPTCAVIAIDLEIDAWKEIIRGIGSTHWYIYPKMLD